MRVGCAFFVVMSADFARLLKEGKQKCYYCHKGLVCGQAVTQKTAVAAFANSNIKIKGENQ